MIITSDRKTNGLETRNADSCLTVHIITIIIIILFCGSLSIFKNLKLFNVVLGFPKKLYPE